MAENLWIIKRMIADAKCRHKELALVFINVSKAFVANESLLQACQYIRIPTQLRNYFKLAYEEAVISLNGSMIGIQLKVGSNRENPLLGQSSTEG